MSASPRVAVFRARLRRGGEERFLSEIRERFPRLIVQLVSMSRAPNARQIEMVANQTVRSIAGGSLLAARPEIDLLLRVAGTTQISEAIRRAGYAARGVKLLVAMGSVRDLRKLEKLAGQGSWTYEKVISSELTTADLEAVERAALLGTGNA